MVAFARRKVLTVPHFAAGRDEKPAALRAVNSAPERKLRRKRVVHTGKEVSVDRAAISARLHSLLDGPGGEIDPAELAARLGVEELSLRMSLDERSPHPTVEVLAAVIRVYGVDPTWLLTGTYDANTHRSVMNGETDPAISVRRMLYEPRTRISEPTREPFHFNDQS
jgi:hypothetical protein